MAIDPATTTTVKVGELASAGFNASDLVPHEVGGLLKKGTLGDLATFIGGQISATSGVGFRAVQVLDGQTLPATTEQEFILVGPGTFPNVGGGASITTTEELNALVSNGTYWFIGVEIPINAAEGAFEPAIATGTTAQYWRGDKTWHDLNKAAVGLSNVDNTTDAGKPISTATQTALDLKANVSQLHDPVTIDGPNPNGLTLLGQKIGITFASSTLNGALSFSDWNTFNNKVPYTGAIGNVDLGTYKLTASDLVVNHASGSGVAASITKGGNGEALTVVKSSGTGNAASITGGVTLLSELNLTTKLADAHINSAATWNAKIGGTGTTNYLPKFTGASTLGNSLIYDNGTNVGIGTTAASYRLEVRRSGDGIQDVLSIENLNQTVGVLDGVRLKIRDFNIESSSTYGSANNIFTIGIGTSKQITLLQNGNVGIGTTSPTTKLEVIGNAKATSFIKSGGTSSQFLKADGSVDSNAYITGLSWDNLTGKPTTVAGFGIVNAVSNVSGVTGAWTGTQAAYDAITTKSSTTIYFIQ